MANALAPYDAMRRQLALASRLDEVKNLADQTGALLEYARRVKDTEAEAELALLKLRAMFHLGRISKGLEKGGGPGRGKRLATAGKSFKSAELKRAGLSLSVAHRCEVLHSIGEDRFEDFLDERRDNGKPVTFIQVYSAISKAGERERKERELGERQLAAPTKIYGVLLADPPWRFDPYSDETGMDRAADNHYPTLTLADIAALPVSDWAAEDAVLFLWVTVPFDGLAHEVLRAWGFKYSSQFVWVKSRPGTGYWSRNRHELLFVAVRGSPPAPAPGTQFDSVIEGPQGKHSAKPERAYEIIEAYFPTLPKLEMFARQERPGWDRWGLEA